MVTNAVEEFRALVSDLASRTRSGEVEWSRVNPTTFSWSNERGVVNIQSVDRPTIVTTEKGFKADKERGYIFNAYDPGGVSRVQLNSLDMKALLPELRELFELAANSVESKGLSFLKNLIG
jgi:hypothetical protein